MDDKEYPKEWIYDDEENPTCTAFEEEEPKFIDPNQIDCMIEVVAKGRKE